MQHLGVDLADIERTLLIRRAQLANTASWIFNIVCLVVVLGGFAYFLSNIRQRKRQFLKNVFHSNRQRGTLQLEIFVPKSMDDNWNLLKLKLDMVYRGLTTEEGTKQFEAIKNPPAVAPPT